MCKSLNCKPTRFIGNFTVSILITIVVTVTSMTATVSKQRRRNIDWQAIEALYLQGFAPAVISAKTGVNARTISIHMCRHGVYKAQQKAISKPVDMDVDAASRVTRSNLAVAAARMSEKVMDPPDSPELLNQHADTAQKVGKLASTVFGWGENSAVAVVLSGVLVGNTDDQPEPAIDVESNQSEG